MYDKPRTKPLLLYHSTKSQYVGSHFVRSTPAVRNGSENIFPIYKTASEFQAALDTPWKKLFDFRTADQKKHFAYARRSAPELR